MENIPRKDIKKVVSWCFFGKKYSSNELTDLVEGYGWNLRKRYKVSYVKIINHFTDYLMDNNLFQDYEKDDNLATYVLNVLYDLLTDIEKVEGKKSPLIEFVNNLVEIKEDVD